MLTPATELESRLRDGMRALDVPPAGSEPERLLRYLRLLDKWNRAFNLTAVRDTAEMVSRHVLDSLSVRPFLIGGQVLDAGTGAGLPGIPLAIVDPERQFVLLDSGGKKVRFVRHAVGELGLGNVRVEHTRVERYVPAAPFDTVVCRALTSLREFVERCGALAAPGGRLVAMKGRRPDAELACLPPGWAATQVAPVQVPGLAGERHIVVLECRPRERKPDAAASDG